MYRECILLMLVLWLEIPSSTGDADFENFVQPDEWEKTQEGGGSDWEFSVRSCSEKLFLDLMINYKDMLMQPLLDVFRNVASMCTTSQLEIIY